MRVLFVWPNKDDPFYRPINISLLSAILKREGHETSCFDTSFVDFGFTSTSDSLTRVSVFKPVDLSAYDVGKAPVDVAGLFTGRLESFKPGVIAFSVLSDEIGIARGLSNVAKKWDASVPVIWGGKGATVEVERVLCFSCVDFVCRGEGTKVLPEFVRAVEAGESPSGIHNICRQENGRVVKNGLYPQIEHLDCLPPLDWSIFDRKLFLKPYDGAVYRGGDHMIGWGCPNRCSYCINSFYREMYGGFKQALYSPGRITAELKDLTEAYGIEFYKFHDEDFLLKPPAYLEELAGLYARRVGVPFSCMVNPRSATDRTVGLLKHMGCASVSLGIETGDMHLRENVLKRSDRREDIIRAFGLLNTAGIRTNAFNMLAVPFETRETYMETIRLNRDAGVQIPQVGFFFPFKKTGLRDIAIENGFYDPSDEKVFDPDRPALHFEDLSEEELRAMLRVFVLYVKLPERFWPFIERCEKGDPVARALESRLHEIYAECVLRHDGWFDDNGRLDGYTSSLQEIQGSQEDR